MKEAPSSLISGSTIYLLSNILTAAVPFALLPVLTRMLGPTEYGRVAMFQLAVVAFGAVIGLCVAGAANRKYFDPAGSDDELPTFIGSCLLILAASTLLAMLFAWPFMDVLSTWTGLESTWLTWAVLVAAAGVVITIRLGQWQVRGQARRYGAFQVSQGLLMLLLALFLVVSLLMGTAGRIYAQVAVALGFSVLAYISLRRDGLALFRWQPDQLREALAFGVPLIPHVAGMVLLRTADRAVINDNFGLHEVGVYVVAVQLAMVMGLLFDAINKAYVPWLFERLARDNPDEKLRVVRWTYLHFGVALLAAATLALSGSYLVPLLAGPGYEAAVSVIGWLALGQAFTGMYLMVTNYIFYSKRTGLLSLATVTTAALHVLLLLVLTVRFGIVGAGMAFALSTCIRFLLTWAIAQRRHPMPWFRALSARRMDTHL